MTNSLRDNIPRLIFGLLTALWVLQTLYTRVWDSSALLALAAVWVAVYEVHRDNAVLIHVQRCAASGCVNVNENGGRPYAWFSIILRNKGVALFQPTMSLSFIDAGGGRVNRPLRIAKEHQVDADMTEFARGMLVVFELKSYRLDPGDDRFLEQLKDLNAQDAYLNIYSQHFLAHSIKLGGREERLKAVWNRMAIRINKVLDTKVKTIGGKELQKQGDLVPRFPLPGYAVTGFIRMLKERSQSDQLPGQR